MERSAVFSDCRRYRYALPRHWTPSRTGRMAMFVGLNPSTADETRDDTTIRRCIAFAQAWEYDSLCMTNLFAFRATQPADMLAANDPIGPDNDCKDAERYRWLRANTTAGRSSTGQWGARPTNW